VQTDSESDETLIRYLLGELSDAERVRLEELYFADDKLHERLSMLEDRMIDSYVRGQLSPDERERFSRLVQTSSEQQRKVEFAEALRRMVAQQAGSPKRQSWWDAVQGFLRAQTLAQQMALAAAAVVVLGGSLVYLRYAKRTPAPPHQFAAKSPARARETTPHEAPILAFALSPLERSGGEENRVVVPAGACVIRLQLFLEDAGTAALNATVQTAEGARMIQLDGLQPQSIGPSGPGSRAVFLVLPCTRFREGHYVIRLSRAAADGTTELIAGYTFRVEHAH
jgi:anti-sigma factor RsiW